MLEARTLTLHDVPSPEYDSCVPSNSQDEMLQQLRREYKKLGEQSSKHSGLGKVRLSLE